MAKGLAPFRLRFALIFFWIIICLTSSLVWGAGNERIVINNMDVVDSNLRDVFRSLAELGRLNVLLDPTVQGKVTVKLNNNLTVLESLELLAQTHGYSYRWLEANRTMIIGNEKTFGNFEARNTQVYRLVYSQASQIAEALNVVVPKERIGIDPRTNQLTINANLLEHQNIKEIIIHLDREMPQLNVEARVEEIQKNLVDSIGVEWEQAPLSLNFITGALTLNDIPRKIYLWEQQSKARVLSNPKIAITDSQEGVIFIGDKYPIITKSVDEKGVTTYKIEYIEVGTKLVVTPRINENDIVTIAVKAMVSSISEWKKAGDNDIPVIRSREASSIVRLRDGETFVLSGLNELKSTETTMGIKFLSKIPIIGWLFKTRKKDPTQDTEICILLTPRIIKNLSKKVSNATAKIEVPPVKNEKIEVAVVQNATISVKSEPEIVESVKLVPNPEPTPADAELAPVVMAREIAKEGYQIKLLVGNGQTLNKISQKYGVSVANICKANNLKTNARLTKGQNLIIPIPEDHLYQVKPNETFWRIAARYGVAENRLAEMNQISDITRIEINQLIVLPCSISRIVDRTL